MWFLSFQRYTPLSGLSDPIVLRDQGLVCYFKSKRAAVEYVYDFLGQRSLQGCRGFIFYQFQAHKAVYTELNIELCS